MILLSPEEKRSPVHFRLLEQLEGSMLAGYDHVCDGTRFIFSRMFLKSAGSLKTLLGKEMVQKGALDR